MKNQEYSPIKIFSDRAHYNRGNRGELSSFLRPYWKDMAFSDDDRLKMYGLNSEDFDVISSIEDADIVVVPMSWNYYLRTGQVHAALELIEYSRQHNKKIIMHTTGDYGITVPFDDVYVLRMSGYKSKRKPREYIQPVFFRDPLKEFYNTEYVIHKSKGPKPSVGFCGLGKANLIKEIAKMGKIAVRNMLNKIKIYYEDSQNICSSTLLRNKVLRNLINSKDVNANFIMREKYRAGVQNEEDKLRTTIEFYRNILENDYTVCVRGGGNFSKRFYETLAMGRIPLLINTDCNLPFENEIDWQHFALIVDRKDLGSLNQRISEQYGSFTDDYLFEIQKECRNIWKEWLNFRGFHKQFAKKIILLEN